MSEQIIKNLKSAIHNAANPVDLGAVEGNLERALGLVEDLESELSDREAISASRDLPRLLNEQIRKAFDHEAEFLKRFWRLGDEEDMELGCVFMGSERTYVCVQLNGGQTTISDAIDTAAFIDWTPEGEG